MFNFVGRKQLAIFAGGVLFGTAGIRMLTGRDAKRGYAHVTAAFLRMKDEVMKNVTAARESCSDIMAEARDINAKREHDENIVVEDAPEQA